jgi:dTDP-4-dehydrorhamnose 3,5-epimerase
MVSMNSAPTPTFSLEAASQLAPDIYGTAIHGLYFINQHRHHDERGFYVELARVGELEPVLGFPFVTKQANHAHSKTNVIRGIHAEGWNKLVSITKGTAFCALADIRPDSPTYGKVETFVLGDNEAALTGALFVSQGIGNSFCVLDGPLDYLYLVDKLYKERDPRGDQAISLFDPDLNIQWPLERSQMILSQRDLNSITLRELYPDSFIA